MELFLTYASALIEPAVKSADPKMPCIRNLNNKARFRTVCVQTKVDRKKRDEVANESVYDTKKTPNVNRTENLWRMVRATFFSRTILRIRHLFTSVFYRILRPQTI